MIAEAAAQGSEWADVVVIGLLLGFYAVVFWLILR